MAFIPTSSGTAQLLTMRGRCVIGYPTTTTCQSVGTVTIQSDANGKPSGQVLGTMGFYLTDSLSSGTPVMKECGTLSPAPELKKGFKYWAVHVGRGLHRLELLVRGLGGDPAERRRRRVEQTTVHQDARPADRLRRG